MKPPRRLSQLVLSGWRATTRQVLFWAAGLAAAAAAVGYILPAHRVGSDVHFHTNYDDGGPLSLVIFAVGAIAVLVLAGRRFGAGIGAGIAAIGAALAGVSPVLLAHMFQVVEPHAGEGVFALGVLGSLVTGAALAIAEPLLYLAERRALARAEEPQLPVARALG